MLRNPDWIAGKKLSSGGISRSNKDDQLKSLRNE